MSYKLVVHLNQSLNEAIIQYVQNFAKRNSYEFYFENNQKEGYVDLFFIVDTLAKAKDLWRHIEAEVGNSDSPVAFIKKEWIVTLCHDENWDKYILLQSCFESNDSKHLAFNFLSDDFSWDKHIKGLPGSAFG